MNQKLKMGNYIIKILKHHQLFLLKRMNGIDIMQWHHRSMISTNEKEAVTK